MRGWSAWTRTTCTRSRGASTSSGSGAPVRRVPSRPSGCAWTTTTRPSPPRPELAGATSRVLDLVSGGEDVADGLQEAAEAAFESLSTTPAIRLQWEQLPIASTGQLGELT